MNAIDYDSFHERVNRNSKVVRYGKSKPVTNEETGDISIVPIKTIDEFSFYKIYLSLNNVVGTKVTPSGNVDIALSDTPIELLAHLMTKDENFTLLYRNKDKKQVELGIELERTAQSVYTSISKLRKAEYIVKNEDNLFVPCQELRDLMKNVKGLIKKNGFVTFDFLFKFCVK